MIFNKSYFQRGERGAALLSLAVALPLAALLLIGMGRLLMGAVSAYRRQAMTDELAAQLQIALGKIVRDLSYAEDVQWKNGDTLYILTRYSDEAAAPVAYTLAADSVGRYHLTREGQPLTGGNSSTTGGTGGLSGEVYITDFSVKIINGRTVVVGLAAKTGTIGAEYSLHTAVTCLNMDAVP